MRFSASSTLIIRVFYSILLIVGVGSIFFTISPQTVHAQTTAPTPVVQQASSTYSDYRTPDTDPNVPINNHSYTQAVLIDVLSALTCQLTGIDSVDPKQPCLTINPVTKKIGLAPTSPNQFGQVPSDTPQIGGALGMATNLISVLYTPTVSSSQYTQYLSDNFGIVKSALAQAPAQTADCSKSQFGYGFCGLQPIFKLWTSMRDIAYALLVICFVVLAVGVMLRFKIDPRTAMTLQNQIPRVIIAIMLITFSYAIAGAMIDMMWTATYVGINLISSAAPDSKVVIDCPGEPKPINQTAQLILLDQPISFTNNIFNANCDGIIHSGVLSLSENVSKSLGGLITEIVTDLLGLDPNRSCGLLDPGACIGSFFLWVTEQIVKLIIVIALFIALFRLWFELIKTYLTLLLFIIFAPIYIVMGLIPPPGKVLGFEKWLRIIFANLAAFPLVAFILVFGRVMIDAIPTGSTPQSVFIPPLVGNPNVEVFSNLIGFGAVMLAPTIPGMIRERMKAQGQGKYGATIAAGVGIAAGAAAAPGKKAWGHLNRRDQHGNAVGAFAVAKQRMGAAGLKKIGMGNVVRKKEAMQSGGITAQNKLRKTIKQENQQSRDLRRLNKMDPTARQSIIDRAHGEALQENERRDTAAEATRQRAQKPEPHKGFNDQPKKPPTS